MSFVKSFKLCGMLAFIILLTLHFSENSKAEFVKDFDCIPQAIKTPAQKGLKIVGEMSEFDPCNASVELYRPDNIKSPPIIIIAHGGGGKRDAINITREFQKLGFATLIFDAYEMNGIPLGRIGNAYRQMMILKTTYAAYEWTLTRKDVDTSKIYFYGISNGASVVINIAGMVDSKHVRGVIAEAPTTTGIGYPNEITIPIKIIFGKLDDLGAKPGQNRWEIRDPCKISVFFDFAPNGTAQTCNSKTKDKNKKSISSMDWVKTVVKKQNTFIEVEFIDDMAHGAFIRELKIDTRDFGQGLIGWSLGGTNKSRTKMLDAISGFIEKQNTS
ncbi:MAG: dienelactone hydrolase family protein [Candidatus Puniceispirillales bacterium]